MGKHSLQLSVFRFPLVLAPQQLFVPEDLMKAKFALLEDTSMVDSSIDIHATLHPGEETPKELLEKRDDVLKNWERLMEESAEVRGLLELQEVQEVATAGDGGQLRLYLEQNHGFKIEALEPLCVVEPYTINNIVFVEYVF
jgi:hypothetical protein